MPRRQQRQSCTQSLVYYINIFLCMGLVFQGTMVPCMFWSPKCNEAAQKSKNHGVKQKTDNRNTAEEQIGKSTSSLEKCKICKKAYLNMTDNESFFHFWDNPHLKFACCLMQWTGSYTYFCLLTNKSQNLLIYFCNVSYSLEIKKESQSMWWIGQHTDNLFLLQPSLSY